MVAEPAVDPPETVPVLLTAAIELLLLAHTPPPVASLSEAVVFWHNTVLPSIALIGFTVTVAIAVQPVVTVYVIWLVPCATPVTIPLDSPTVACAIALLLQVPAPVASLNVIVDPTHTGVLPSTGVIGLTVMSNVLVQPVTGNV